MVLGCSTHSEEYDPLSVGVIPRNLSLAICSRMMSFKPCCCGLGDCLMNDIKNDWISHFLTEESSLDIDSSMISSFGIRIYEDQFFVSKRFLFQYFSYLPKLHRKGVACEELKYLRIRKTTWCIKSSVNH